MRKILSMFLMILVLLFPGTGRADIVPQKYVLDNGLTVLVSEMPQSPTVCVFMYVKAGAATEGKFAGAGISHLTEHMMFKGTEKRPAGEIASEIQSLGGTVNASTGKDFTLYTIRVPYEAFEQAVDIMSDMIMRPAFDEEEFAREKEVILSEIRLYNDKPDSRLSYKVFETAYLNHPYRFPTIGYEPVFKNVSREDLLEYYRTFYVPNNMILSIAGNVTEEHAREVVEEKFSGFPRQSAIVRNLPEEAEQIAPRRTDDYYETDLSRLALVFPGVRFSDKDMYALDVLASVLGQGRSSRLYQGVKKDQGLVYDISAGNYTPMDAGIFTVEAVLDEADITKTVAEVQSHIQEIQNKGVRVKELEKARKGVLSGYLFSRETSAGTARRQVFDEAFMGDASFSEKYVESVKAVTSADIRDAARKYLTPERMSTVILHPGSRPSQDSRQAIKDSDIQKKILPDGMVLLLKRDERAPTVSLRATFSGGLREDPEGLPGVSYLAAKMLSRGTRKRSAEKIASIAESNGMRIAEFSGNNSFGLTVHCLSEDIGTAMDLLRDMILHPVFDQAELDDLKKETLAAIKQRKDSVTSFAYQEMKQQLFFHHPLRYEADGTEESVKKITREDLLAFYKNKVAANNMIVSVFGDINPEEIARDVQSGFQPLMAHPIVKTSFPEEKPEEVRFKEVTTDKEQAVVVVGFQGVSFTDKDRTGLEVLTSVLGSPFQGRMFTNIRDKLGKAYRLGGHFIPSTDLGMISFYVSTSPEEADNVLALLKEEILSLREKEVPLEELKSVKAYLKGTFAAGQERPSDLNAVVAFDELYGLGFDYYQTYARRIDAVTPEEIQRLAKDYLTLDKMAVVISRPVSDKEKPGAQQE